MTGEVIACAECGYQFVWQDGKPLPTVVHSDIPNRHWLAPGAWCERHRLWDCDFRGPCGDTRVLAPVARAMASAGHEEDCVWMEGENACNCPDEPRPAVEPYADVPSDVCDWLDETYTPDGVGIWLLAWAKADEAKRAHMIAVARIPSGGS